MKNYLFAVPGLELIWISEWTWKLTVFLCVLRKWRRFGVFTETVLVLACESKLAWFLWASRKWLVFIVGIDSLGFCVGGRNWLGCVLVAKINWVICGYQDWSTVVFVWVCRNWICFCIRAGHGLLIVWRSMNLVLWGWAKLAWFLCTVQIWLGFGEVDEIDLFFFVRGFDIDLIST